MKNKMKCKECNKHVDWMEFEERTAEKMKTLCLCFDCLFWSECCIRRDAPESVRIEGDHYIVSEEADTGYLRGYGGVKFRIKFFDGRKIETTNLWSQGPIPERFRDRLPNNATFKR